ncbi:hypothetical protein I3W98_36345, partial [Streptomyces cavourensis]|nr:hypothetical protein [Streptomyces cavourensis]
MKPGGLPVEVSPAVGGDIVVEALGRKAAEAAGVDGVVLAIEGGRGAADVKVDYSAFQDAYGGGWASRLTLAELPACALTTPDEAACRPRPLDGVRNNPEEGTVTARADLSGSVSAAREEDGPRTLSAADWSPRSRTPRPPARPRDP